MRVKKEGEGRKREKEEKRERQVRQLKQGRGGGSRCTGSGVVWLETEKVGDHPGHASVSTGVGL